jgi:hypothetical protein
MDIKNGHRKCPLKMKVYQCTFKNHKNPDYFISAENIPNGKRKGKKKQKKSFGGDLSNTNMDEGCNIVILFRA